MTDRILPCVLLLLTGCAAAPVVQGPASPSTAPDACINFYRTAEQAISQAAVGDAGGQRLPGYPFLRSNRYLADAGHRLDNPEQWQEWVAALAQLDLTTRRRELANLPPADLASLSADWRRQLTRCSARLTAQLKRHPEMKQPLIDAAQVDDSYQTWKRVVGLYPIAALFSYPAIESLHNRLRQPFLLGKQNLPVQGRLQRYAPPPDPEVLNAVVRSVQENFVPYPPPGPGPMELRRLFRRHAPVLEVDQLGDADRIGRVHWQDEARAVVDTATPVVYLYASQTRFQQRRLLQLNYLFWFPERNTDDIYSGRFDALIWRVTLDGQRQPLAYDSIHGCGCYYQLFPAPGYRRIPSPAESEPVLSPVPAPAVPPDGRLVLRIAAGSHYLQSIYTDEDTPEKGQHYDWADYHGLLSLPVPGNGWRSLFDANGLIEASARPERYLLWPFGIPSPGAMRQPGTHAIAFVGRRHFDDAGLLQSLVSAAQGAPAGRAAPRSRSKP